MFEGNIDKSNVKAKIRVEHFHFITLKKFYVAIWSCMKLKDVFEILSLLMLKILWTNLCSFEEMNNVYYFWQNYNWVILLSEGLKHVYYACCGLPYEKEDQMLPIDHEPNKMFQNPKSNSLFIESFRGDMLSKNKVQCSNLTSCLWPANLSWIATSKHNLSPLWHHGQVFQTSFEFVFMKLFIVLAIYE
jgi:hypothetical protein